jgi:hypothetical protein
MIRLAARVLARANDLGRANSLANALTLARDLASDLHLDHAEALVGTLARVNALALALARANALNLDNTLDIAHTLTLSHHLARALTSASDLVVNPSRDVTRTSDLTHARFARASDLPSDLPSDLDVARGLVRDLVRDLVDLDPAAHWAKAVVAGGAPSMPGLLSRGLVALAVRLLPVSQRSRYRAEFRVELLELSRRERLGYALRVLAGAWELRRALVDAVYTPDGAAARRAAKR